MGTSTNASLPAACSSQHGTPTEARIYICIYADLVDIYYIYTHIWCSDVSLLVYTHAGKEEEAHEADWDHDIYTCNTDEHGLTTSGHACEAGGTPAQELAKLQAKYPASPEPAEGDLQETWSKTETQVVEGCSVSSALERTGLEQVTKLAPCDQTLRHRRITREQGKGLPNEDLTFAVTADLLASLASPASEAERTVEMRKMIDEWLKPAEPSSESGCGCIVQ